MRGLVPELHDLLKLTTLVHDISQWDQRNPEAFQTFQSFFPRRTRTWQGVLQHHCSDWYTTAYPVESETFHLHIADWLASSFSRSGERATGEVFTVHKLWRPPTSEIIEEIRLDSNEKIIALFKFCSGDPSWEEFLSQYEYILRNRAEDANPGMNIVSLYTHCKLTGQFYRILRRSPQFAIAEEQLSGKTKEDIAKLVTQKRGSTWQLTVARCKFRSFQNPFRARDLNMFRAVEDLTQEIKSLYPDNVLFSTSDELLLVVADENQLLDIAAMAHQRGFWVEIVKNRRLLSDLHPNPESKQSPKKENLYNLPTEISPPICDLCQAAKATKTWPEDYVLSHKQLCPKCQELLSKTPLSSAIDFLCLDDKAKLEDILEEPAGEDLCENCFSLRAEEPKLIKLSEWERDAQSRIAWLKVKLNFDQLTNTLEKLYSTQFPSQKIEIRFSVVSEFQEDYSRFLEEFHSRIGDSFRIQNVEKIMNDFFCLKVGSFKETRKILQVYHQVLEDFFPAFLNLKKSPLRIAIVCTNPKFPFFEVWRILEGSEEDVFISLQGRGTMRVPTKVLKLLIEASNKPYRKSALHKLSRIEETSPTLAELVFQNRRDEDSRTYSTLDKALRPHIDFSSIFSLARLLGD